MTKADLARQIATSTGLTRAEATAAADAFLAGVIEAVLRGERVELRGFGAFRSVTRAPRTGRNPRTGEIVRVPQRRAVSFKPTARLKRLPDFAPTKGPGGQS